MFRLGRPITILAVTYVAAQHSVPSFLSNSAKLTALVAVVGNGVSSVPPWQHFCWRCELARLDRVWVKV